MEFDVDKDELFHKIVDRVARHEGPAIIEGTMDGLPVMLIVAAGAYVGQLKREFAKAGVKIKELGGLTLD